MTWVLQLFQQGQEILDDLAEFRAFWGDGAVLVQVFGGELKFVEYLGFGAGDTVHTEELEQLALSPKTDVFFRRTHGRPG